MPLILGNGHYIPYRELAQGGSSCAFLAWDRKYRAERVVKQFRVDRFPLAWEREIALNALFHETNVLGRLKHPGIPRGYEPFQVTAPPDARTTGTQNLGDWGQIDHAHETPLKYTYSAQEYIAGKDLQQIFADHPPQLESSDPMEMFIMFRQMLKILDYIHTRPIPIIHCDLQPANIVKTKHGGKYQLSILATHHPNRKTIMRLISRLICTPLPKFVFALCPVDQTQI
jgi:serine/threonine protein kinase